MIHAILTKRRMMKRRILSTTRSVDFTGFVHTTEGEPYGGVFLPGPLGNLLRTERTIYSIQDGSKVNHVIRPAVKDDEPFLWEMLYYAAHLEENRCYQLHRVFSTDHHNRRDSE